MRKSTETDLVKSCLQLLHLCGVFAWRNNSGGLKAGKRFVRFGHPGSADILGILPLHREGSCDDWPPGRFLAVECKCGPNDLTDGQIVFGTRILDEGGVYLLVRDVASLQAWLQGAGLWKE